MPLCSILQNVLLFFCYQVRDLWKHVEEFNSSRAGEQAIVESILERTLDSYRIDATQLNVKVPDLLLRECEREIQRVCGVVCMRA